MQYASANANSIGFSSSNNNDADFLNNFLFFAIFDYGAYYVP